MGQGKLAKDMGLVWAGGGGGVSHTSSAALHRTAGLLNEALKELAGDTAINAVYVALCDHPHISSDKLEELGNRLARVPFEREWSRRNASPTE